MRLVLASQSSSRRAMLNAVGVDHFAVRPPLDEESEKVRLKELGLDGQGLAAALAIAKARSVVPDKADDLILGCDQTLECADGSLLDKAADQASLATQLRGLSGQTHRLHSAAVIVQNGNVIWDALETAVMHVRPLSDAFIEGYLQAEGDDLLYCVGGYRIEGRGVQLFDRVDGCQFVVQGLPLLPLLAFLRTRKLILS